MSSTQSIASTLLPEFEREMAGTRKVLARVPKDRLDFRPHPKAPTLGWLAGHLAQIPGYTKATLGSDSMDIVPVGVAAGKPADLSNIDELLARFDESFSAAHSALIRASDDELRAPWTLLKGGEEVFRLPRAAVLRTMVMNHMIHHRGQIEVYLRMLDVPLPALYGPSGDEPA